MKNLSTLRWEIEYDNDSYCQWYAIGPAKVEVAYNLSQQEKLEWEENAKLIAAAPDLLRTVQIAYDELLDFNRACPGMATDDSIMTMLKGAIDKATK